MNAATKPTEFPDIAWTERWTVSESEQHPNDSTVAQPQQLDCPGPDAMTFVETAMPCSAR